MPKSTGRSASDLSRLYFGKDDAESDIGSGGLLRQGFLKTAAYMAAKQGRKQLIIGRKGSGKSAICMTLWSMPDSRHNVALVTPDEISADEIRRFELPGITSAQSKSLIWRYVLAVQVAKLLISHARAQLGDNHLPASVSALRRFLFDNGEQDDIRFQEKLWKVIERIKSSVHLEAFGQLSGFGAKVSVDPAAPSEGIRASNQLEIVEKGISRTFDELRRDRGDSTIVLLVDQLEKVWSNDQDSDAMVTGLLVAAKHLTASFPVHCVVFLRTDIYELLQFQDRDKFRGEELRIDWNPDLLLDLVHVRAEASLGSPLKPIDLWRKVFPASISGEEVSNFLVSRTLMRPRDIIQLCNVCRDTAEKNGHEAILEEDVKEASVQYSNWKLQDLIGEYRVNYPFLSDMFVLFQSTSFVITRPTLDRKLGTVITALAARYPQYVNVFNLDSILRILYGIGFLGVLRDEKPTYVYADPNTIEHHETQFLIHPCFREALRSVSSVDMRPYEPLVLTERIYSELSPASTSFGQSRGTRASRLLMQIDRLCEQLSKDLLDWELPSDVRSEISQNVQLIRQDVGRANERTDPFDGRTSLEEYELTQKVLQFFEQLADRLAMPGLVQGERSGAPTRTVREAARELRFASQGPDAVLA